MGRGGLGIVIAVKGSAVHIVVLAADVRTLLAAEVGGTTGIAFTLIL